MVLVSIVMPCYNAEKYIEKAINSVICQSYSKWELLVVDDCSIDNSAQIVKKLAETDSRVKYFRLNENSGSPAAPRNVALKNALGSYIAFLDADDEWLPNKLKIQLEFMIDRDIKFSCTSYEIKFLNGNSIKYVPPSEVSYDDLLKNNSIGCLTAMIDKEIIKEDLFPVMGHEDYALWLRVLSRGYKVCAVPEVLAIYNKIESSVSSNKLRLISFYWNIYRKSERFSRFKAIYLCVVYFVNVVWFKYK